jgi:hypothetical protein
MDQSQVWGLPRYITLAVVLVLHMALVVALLMASGTRTSSSFANQPIELIYLPPPAIPKIRAENSRPRHLSGDTAISVPLPVLDLTSPAASPGSASNGSGSGVDWAAEARRALQAFEIRKHQPPSNTTVSRSPAEDIWWPLARHHAGDQFKTASGDWIVWVSASCYQVATSAANANVPGPVMRPTVCVKQESREQREQE